MNAQAAQPHAEKTTKPRKTSKSGKTALGKKKVHSLQGVLQHYTVAHSIPGRMRLRPLSRTVSAATETMRKELEAFFPGCSISVSERTGSVLVLYTQASGSVPLLSGGTLTYAEHVRGKELPAVPSTPGENEPRNPIPGKIRSILFYPNVVSYSLAVFRSVPYVVSALCSLVKGRLGLDVLDGAALLVCLVQRDFRSLSSITFFFALGEYLAAWTRKKSRASLAESLALKFDTVWLREGDLEREIPFAELNAGDHVVVRAGFALPVDGTVVEGQGMVNQASMTGEALPVHRMTGATVYAGTVLEEGELLVRATKVGSNTRINAILQTIEESESVKASIQGKYERMADAIVPYNFLLCGLVYALTRNLAQAGSTLLVDYSCAIRLSTPLSIVTAMRVAADQGVLIKGGKFMEAIAESDVIIFDKTGTLTRAKPELVDVIPFGGRSRQDILRLAACLEEHFVHPVGQAVVRASDNEGLKHREEHARVEYVVAHGIASIWHEKRVLIGSGHFVLEDEGITLTPEQEKRIHDEADKGRSILYLCIGGELAGVLLIEDSIRENTADVIQKLRDDGIKRIIMLTGDGERTAAGIAARAGITEYRSALLPEDKAAYVANLRKEGWKVAMVGDGINDSPALAAANVGVAMTGGADMAREVADMVLVNDDLEGILIARAVSREAIKRIRFGFTTSVCLNSLFLVGGLTGIIRPALSAFLHNATTAALAASSVRTVKLNHESPAEHRRLEA